MSDNKERKFKFWLPIDKIEKAKDKDGNEVMVLGGIASTARLDMDLQTLNPTEKGFDVTYLQERGIVNWNHSKAPEAVIGEPTKIEFRPEGMYVESMLYGESDLAKKVYELGKRFKKNSKTRRLGYSIEGGVMAKNPLNPDDIVKARITGLALTVNPKNADSIVDIIKGNFHDYSDEANTLQKDIPADITDISAFEEANGGKVHLIDITKPDGTRIIVDEGYNLKIYKDLSAGSESGRAIQPESLNPKLKVTAANTLTKGEVIDKIIDHFGVISVQSIDKIFKGIKPHIMEQNNNTDLTPKFNEEKLNKALEVLGAEMSIDTLEKGVVAEAAEEAKPAATEAAAAEKPAAEAPKEIEKAVEEAPKVEAKPAVAAAAPAAETLAKGFDFDGLAKGLNEKFGAVGVLIKGMNNKLNQVLEENANLKTEIGDLNKSLDETPAGAGRKSNATAKAVERNFEKGLNAEETGANETLQKALTDGTAIHIGDKKAVANLLDDMTFEKGMDQELAKALTLYEAGGTMAPAIAARIKRERGITIVS